MGSNATGWIERDVRDLAGTSGLYDPQPIIRDGMLAVPEGPGWGVEIRDSWLRQAQRTVSPHPG